MLPAWPLPGDLIAVLVEDDRVDAERGGPAGARLHRLEGGQGAAQEPAGLGLPPGVDDDRLALADLGVIPAPDLGLDRLAHGGHVLEVVVVLGGLVRAHLAEHPDRGRRGVEDIHPELLGDPPGAARVRVVRRALVDHAGGAQRKRAVDDVGVAGDPADVGHAPVGVVRGGCPGSTWTSRRRRTGSRRCCAGSPWAAGGAAGVHQEQRRLGGHRDRRHGLAGVLADQVVHEEVAARRPSASRRVLARVPPPDQHLVDLLALPLRLGDRLVGLDLVVESDRRCGNSRPW